MCYRSEVLYPEGYKSPASAAPAEAMRNARDFILYNVCARARVSYSSFRLPPCNLVLWFVGAAKKTRSQWPYVVPYA